MRKKIDGKNLADNILKWRVGGLNIDETKVGVGKRWAANVIINHDENCSDERCVKNCAVRILDEQSGIRQSGKENGSATVGVISNGSITPMRRGTLVPRDDVGGASRFFYCPKISSSERNLLSSNAHPTVKPIKLMSYLCKLITPPEGIILDPFMGTGSTGIAALLEDFNFIGVEREKEYFETAKIRIENYLDFGKFLGKNNTPPETTLF